jgi:hypothetical protein
LAENRNAEDIVNGILLDIARPYRKIEGSTRVYEDLLICGDDAWELFERIHKEFQGCSVLWTESERPQGESI